MDVVNFLFILTYLPFYIFLVFTSSQTNTDGTLNHLNREKGNLTPWAGARRNDRWNKVSEPQKTFVFESQGNKIFHHVVLYIKGGSKYTVTLHSNFCSVGKGKRMEIVFWLLAILH